MKNIEEGEGGLRGKREMQKDMGDWEEEKYEHAEGK